MFISTISIIWTMRIDLMINWDRQHASTGGSLTIE
jgi:hypothetical protein